MDVTSRHTRLRQSQFAAPHHSRQPSRNGYAEFDETGRSSPPELAEDVVEAEKSHGLLPHTNISVDKLLSRLEMAPNITPKHHGSGVRVIKVRSSNCLPRERHGVAMTSLANPFKLRTGENPKISIPRKVRFVHFSPRDSEDGNDEVSSKNKITQTIATHTAAQQTPSFFQFARQFQDKSVNTSPGNDYDELPSTISRNLTGAFVHQFQRRNSHTPNFRMPRDRPPNARDHHSIPCSYAEAYEPGEIYNHKLDNLAGRECSQRAASHAFQREASPIHKPEADPVTVSDFQRHPVQVSEAPKAFESTPDSKKIDIFQHSQPMTIDIVHAPPSQTPNLQPRPSQCVNSRREILQAYPPNVTEASIECLTDANSHFSWQGHPATASSNHGSWEEEARCAPDECDEDDVHPKDVAFSIAPDLTRPIRGSLADTPIGGFAQEGTNQGLNNRKTYADILLAKYSRKCNGDDTSSFGHASHEPGSPGHTSRFVTEDGSGLRRSSSFRSDRRDDHDDDLSVRDSDAEEDITWLEFEEQDTPPRKTPNFEPAAAPTGRSGEVMRKKVKDRTSLLAKPPFAHAAAQKRSTDGLGSSYWFDVPFQGNDCYGKQRRSETGESCNLRQTKSSSFGDHDSHTVANNMVAMKRREELFSPIPNTPDISQKISSHRSSKSQGRAASLSQRHRTRPSITVGVEDSDSAATMATAASQGAGAYPGAVYPGVLWPKFALYPGDIMMTRNLRREASKVGGYVTLFPDTKYFEENRVDVAKAATKFPGYYQFTLFDMVLRLGRFDIQGDWSWNPSSFLYLFMYTPPSAAGLSEPSWWLVDSKPAVKMPLPGDHRHESTEMPLNSRLQLSPRNTDLVISTIPDPMLVCKKRWRAQWWSSHYLPLTQDVLVRASFGARTTPANNGAAEPGDTVRRPVEVMTTATVELYSYCGDSVATWRFLGRDACSYGPPRGTT